VITTSSLARLLNPTPLNPTTLFESIKQRIKRRDIEPQPSLGPLLDQIPDVISMPGLILNERQNQQLRTSLLQLPVQHLRKLIWHSDILLRCISPVNFGIFGCEILISGLVSCGFKSVECVK